VLQLGLPDEFIEHGDPAKLLASVGLDAAGIESSIRQRFSNVLGGSAGLKAAA
jgi:1-deoxy-D-xylulose-5-phosphate synthase